MKKLVDSSLRERALPERGRRGSFFRGLLFAIPLAVLLWIAILMLF